MQRTDTILERIDAEGGQEAEPQEEGGDGTVPFVDIDDIPQNGQLVVGDALGNALKFLPTLREGNVFTGVCHSVYSRSHAYSVTAHLVGYSVTCYGAVGTHPTGMLSCWKLKGGD